MTFPRGERAASGARRVLARPRVRSSSGNDLSSLVKRRQVPGGSSKFTTGTLVPLGQP